MPDAPTTQAEQEDAVRADLIAFLDDRYWQKPEPPADTADALLAGPLATLRTERDAAVTRAAEEEVGAAMDRAFREIADLRVAKVEAQRDQLAADLRKAREALKWAASEFDNIANNADPFDDAAGTQDHGLLLKIEGQAGRAGERVRALTPDPKDAGGTAKGEDHGA